MKNFFIEVNYRDPYPLKKEYRIEGTKFPIAVKRALDLFREDTKGKRIKKFWLVVVQL